MQQDVSLWIPKRFFGTEERHGDYMYIRTHIITVLLFMHATRACFVSRALIPILSKLPKIPKPCILISYLLVYYDDYDLSLRNETIITILKRLHCQIQTTRTTHYSDFITSG